MVRSIISQCVNASEGSEGGPRLLKFHFTRSKKPVFLLARKWQRSKVEVSIYQLLHAPNAGRFSPISSILPLTHEVCCPLSEQRPSIIRSSLQKLNNDAMRCEHFVSFLWGHAIATLLQNSNFLCTRVLAKGNKNKIERKL